MGECVGQPEVGLAVVSSSSGCHHLFMLPLSLPRDVSVELPFVLMHPKPHDHVTAPRPQSGKHVTPSPKGRTQSQASGESWSYPPTHPLSSSPQLLLKQMPRWTPTSLNLIPSKILIPSLPTFDSCTKIPITFKSTFYHSSTILSSLEGRIVELSNQLSLLANISSPIAALNTSVCGWIVAS